MKKVLHLTFFLALVAAIAGGALAFANSITAPKIAAIALAAEEENLRIIFPDAQSTDFEEVNVTNSENIEKIFKVNGKGTIFKMKVKGYKEGTSFMVALADDGKIIDFTVISNGDTQGIGTKVMDESFRKSLVDKHSADKLDVISGATISSEPIVNGIAEAGKYLSENMK